MRLHGRSLVYKLMEDFVREAKLEERTVFITRQQNMVAHYMAMRTIADLFLWQHGQGCEWESGGVNRRGCAYQKNGRKQRWELWVGMINEQKMGQSIRRVDNKYSIVTIAFNPGKEPPP